MLVNAAATSAIKPLVYHPPVSLRPEVKVSLINNLVTLQVLIPAARAEDKGQVIIRDISAPPGQRESVMFSVIQEMIAWIETHLDQNLSVEKISERSGYSVWHFQRKFVQLTGLNVYEYVRLRRVINATFALINSNKRILEVAVDNGFNCQASFTRTVREITGYTPAVIRKTFSDRHAQWLTMIDALINVRRV